MRVGASLDTNSHVPDHDLLRKLNHTAVVMVSDHAGSFRPHDAVINRSPHKPPPWQDVPNLTNEFLLDLRKGWGSSEPIWLASFCLWRINWIHPFAEGNSRTARAVAYFVLCVKFGMWLPCGEIIPQRIRNDREPYYKALGKADASAKSGTTDILELCSYLEGLLTAQLSSS